MGRIRTVALTGGPSGGKSGLHNAISERIVDAYHAPEVATILLSGGFPAPTEEYPWDETWQRDFQIGVAAAQICLENIVTRRAVAKNKHLIIFDRGLIDGAAYLRGGVRELEEITGLSEQTMLSRYDTVLHLTSSAAHNRYDKHSNPHRFEDAESALELENRTLEVWQNHPRYVILDHPDRAQRIADGLSIVSSLSLENIDND